jgi:hypothetical protein
MKVGDLVQVNHYAVVPGKQHGPIGLIISRALSVSVEWWIVEWMGIGPTLRPAGRETIRSEHLKVIS